MKLLLGCVAVFYLVMALRFLFVWLKFTNRDTDLSLRQKQLSFGLLAISTILWPLIVPFAYLELLSKAENENILVITQVTNETNEACNELKKLE